MLYLILLFTILFFILAWRRLDLAVMLLIAALPAYLIRFNVFGLPSTLLEAMILIVFLVWLVKNFSRVKNNFLENFKKENKKIKISYPFAWEIILWLLVAFAAAAFSGFSAGSLGIWKAYFFEPMTLFIVVVNLMKKSPPTPFPPERLPARQGHSGGMSSSRAGPPERLPARQGHSGGMSSSRAGVKGENTNPPLPPFTRGVELALWPLAISALVVSILAIYQKFTGALIDTPVWADESARRVVSFFGYPNAVGLYLGPLALVFVGWLCYIIINNQDTITKQYSNFKQKGNKFGNWNLKFIWDLGFGIWNLKIIFISLTIILSILSIYFAKSKGALMGVTAGLIVFGLLAGKKVRWAVIIVLILISAGIASNQPLRHQTFKYLTLNDFSGQVRRAQWRETWAMLKDGRVLIGAGLANYQAAIINYHLPGVFIKDFDDPDAQRKLVFNAAYRSAYWQPLEIYLYPHNIILNFWSELGAAGLLLFIWIIIKYFWLGIFNFQFSIFNKFSINKFLNIGLICAMTVIVMHGAVDAPYFKNDLSVMFWLFVAMMSSINLENKYGE